MQHVSCIAFRDEKTKKGWQWRRSCDPRSPLHAKHHPGPHPPDVSRPGDNFRKGRSSEEHILPHKDPAAKAIALPPFGHGHDRLLPRHPRLTLHERLLQSNRTALSFPPFLHLEGERESG